jgi:hypothetical protein
MGWFLRAIEQTDGGWACAHGRTVHDRHTGLPDALEHLHGIAETISPAQLVVHRLDGTVQNLGYAFAPTPTSHPLVDLAPHRWQCHLT